MKKSLLVLLALAFVFTGCSTQIHPFVGTVISAGTTSPMAVTSNEIGPKCGTAKAISIFGVSAGDASIQTAAKNAGISKVSTVDYKVTNILFVYVGVTTIVTGS